LKDFIATTLSILNRQEKVKMCTNIVLDFAVGLLDIAFLGVLLLVINFYTNNSSTHNSFLAQSLTNKNSLVVVGVFFMLFSLKNYLGYRVSKAQNSFFFGIASRLAKRNIWHYLKDDYTRFINIDSSIFTRKISQQPIEFSNYILINIQQVISQSILIFFTIIGILFYHPKSFLSLFLLLVPPVILLAFLIKKKLKQVRASLKVSSQKTIQHLQESLSGYVESNIYNKNNFFVDRFYQYKQQLDENIATQQTLQILPSRLIEVFAVLGFFILMAINKLWANAPAIDLLTIGIFMAAAYKVIPGIIKILNSTGQMKTYQFTLDDLSLPVTRESVTADKAPASPIRSLKFEQVYFKYNDHTVLNGVSFQLAPGDFAGMSAASGKGKTTIINLLLGFLKPDCGGICLNNKKADHEERQRYWSRISYVKQQPFFIHDTILKNITLSDDEYDTAKLEEVLSFCGIDELLGNYPEGLEKIIKENGKNISGGQRQRIMLARALYHDFDLLILDEPFGELDERSEKQILVKLAALANEGKMILFITHKKTSLSFCNKILSLDGE
jgi:ABC-type multidrug transport system fused ATPase/permease subunit